MVLNASAAEKLQHVVCLKFKATATPQDIQNVEDAFKALKKKVLQVSALEWGTNVSTENQDKGFTHCFILSFKSEKDRDAYLVHPAHKAFGKLAGPVLDDVFVVDFWASK
jgi:UDP-N-acetylenolpyruvoylglucosamine reductase